MPRSDALEIQLLRSSVDALEADHQRCADCRRTPLTGERVYLYGDGHRACELCRTARHEEPAASEPVRGGTGHLVRVNARAA
jgi:hypothetical protein